MISKSHWDSLPIMLLTKPSYLKITTLQPDIELGKLFSLFGKPFVHSSFPVLMFPILLRRNSFLSLSYLWVVVRYYGPGAA